MNEKSMKAFSSIITRNKKFLYMKLTFVFLQFQILPHLTHLVFELSISLV